MASLLTCQRCGKGILGQRLLASGGQLRRSAYDTGMRAARLLGLITAITTALWVVDSHAPSYVRTTIYNPKLLPEWFIIGMALLLIVIFPALLKFDMHKLTILGYAFFSAGACANLGMRTFLGPVPDFIPVPGHPGTQFNLADISLLIGISIALFAVLFLPEGQEAPAPS